MQKTALVEIGRHAEDHGILACVENMISIKDFLCRYPEEISASPRDTRIGITLDVGHANTNGLVDAFSAISRRSITCTSTTTTGSRMNIWRSGMGLSIGRRSGR